MKTKGEFTITTLLAASFCLSLSLSVARADDDENVAAYGNETQAAVDPVGVAEISYHPVKIFKEPNGFVGAQSAMPLRPDTILRGGLVTPTPPVCVWINGDYGEDKGRSYLEGGMSVQFMFLKNARYPLIVAIPANIAVGDEEYWFGPHFGHVTTGVNVQVPLSFIPNRYGKWTVGSSADLCYYGTTLNELVKSIGLPGAQLAATFSVDF